MSGIMNNQRLFNECVFLSLITATWWPEQIKIDLMDAWLWRKTPKIISRRTKECVRARPELKVRIDLNGTFYDDNIESTFSIDWWRSMMIDHIRISWMNLSCRCRHCINHIVMHRYTKWSYENQFELVRCVEF